MPTEGSRATAVVAHVRRVPAAQRQAWLETLRQADTRGLIVVATCHRVEVYGSRDQLAELPRADGVEALDEEATARHLIELAAGLRSIVVGEDQVLHQLREAVWQARRSGGLPTGLDRLADLALRAGRLARSWRTQPARSLADVALDRVIGADPGNARVAVVGTGEMGRLAVRAALRRGAHVVVAGHRVESASRLAAELGVPSAPFDLTAAAPSVSGVIVALRGHWAVAESAVETLVARSVPVVDLSAPAAVDHGVRSRLGPLYTSIDDLATMEGEGSAPLRRRLERLVDDTLAEYERWLDARAARSAAEALADRALRERALELDSLWRRLPELDPAARREIEAMTEHLAARLLREPLTRLGRDADGRHEQAARELFGL